MSRKQQLRQTIEHVEKEIRDSRYRNEQLEKYLAKLQSEEMEEDIKETENVQLLKG
jgi:uncharacterized protein YeeX (DUF496 family)